MKLPEFQAYLKENGIDAVFLVHPDPAITYFTQLKPSYSYLVITPRDADFHLTKLDPSPRLKKITVRLLHNNWYKKHTASRKIGINKELLTVQQFEKLKKAFPGARFVDIGQKLHQLRSQKTPEEITKIATACQITGDALHALVKELPRKRIRTERDVAEFLEQHMKQQGATIAFPTIAAMGKNAAIPHHLTSSQPLKRGFLVIDFGACYLHYCADMTRVLFLGIPTQKEREFYHLLLNSQQQAVNHILHEKPFSELDKIARKHLGSYSSHFIHSLGHGIGIEVHEAPHFLDKTQTIQKNQVFTIEPGIYFPGKFGLRIEDTIMFDGDLKILTTFPKELITIDF